MINIKTIVKDRLYKGTRKYIPILMEANVMDSDKKTIIKYVTGILADIFGHDKNNIAQSSNTLYDLAIKINDKDRIIIKCVSGATSLEEDCMKETVEYAINSNIDFSILTNGSDWYFFKGSELIYDINLIDVNPKDKNDLEMLYVLCVEACIEISDN